MARQNMDDVLVRSVKAVIPDFNRLGNIRYPRFHAHRWSRDSAFIAMGCAHHQEHAIAELTHLLQSQRNNGFSPGSSSAPASAVTSWNPTSGGPDKALTLPKKPKSAVLPPVHATVLSLYQHADNEAGVKEFLECPLPKLGAWHGTPGAASVPANAPPGRNTRPASASS
jgi:hypothetical protein